MFSLIGILFVEKSKNEDEERIKGLLQQIEELSAKQHEKEAELALAKKTISEFQATGVIKVLEYYFITESSLLILGDCRA